MSQPPKRRKKGWMDLRITRIKQETHDTKTFFLVNSDEGTRAFDYIAGQYLTFRFDALADKPVVRSYTLSSSPNQPDHIAFTVKGVPGGLVSNWLIETPKEGDILRARGPIGRFVCPLEPANFHLVMIAAGSGVTPFVSIIRQHAPMITQSQTPKSLTLLVSYRSTKDLICWEDLQELQQYEGVNIVTTLTRENQDGYWQGRPSPEMIDRLTLRSYEEKSFMTCGPTEMMDMVVDHLKEKGVSEGSIHTESFF